MPPKPSSPFDVLPQQYNVIVSVGPCGGRNFPQFFYLKILRQLKQWAYAFIKKCNKIRLDFNFTLLPVDQPESKQKKKFGND